MPEAAADTGLFCTVPALDNRAQALCRHYGLPRLKRAPADGWYLHLDADGLRLVPAGQPRAGVVRVDFVGGALGHRLRFGGGRGQALARAVGLKPGFDPVVWDATAGLGRDAFVLASLGCRVTLCERSPVLAALLDEGLQRAALDADIGDWVQSRMQLRCADSTRELARLDPAQAPDTVYLDPMYPPGKSSVLVKKEMRAVQQLAGEDRDSGALLDSALAVARRRVVVKRPRRADPIGTIRPSASVESKKTRYDIYVTL